MLKFLDEKDWIDEISKARQLYFNETSAVVQAMAKNFALQAQYLIYYVKGKPIISLLAFTTQHKIVKPIHFFYSAIWVDDQLSDNSYCKYLSIFLQELQCHFKRIEFNLPPNIKDIRPFLWNAFAVENRFTYYKSLSSTRYAKDVEKNLRGIQGSEYSCLSERLSAESLELNVALLSKLLFKKSQIKKIVNLLGDLDATGKLTCYNCYKLAHLVASNILFVDEDNHIAYTILLNKRKEHDDDVHVLLHDYFFKDLKGKGFEIVDLMGADLQSIAAFKSRFLTDLMRHYVVSYSSTRRNLNMNVSKIRNVAKKVVGFFD